MLYALIIFVMLTIVLGIICIMLAKVCIVNEAELIALRKRRTAEIKLINRLEDDRKYLRDTLERIKHANKPCT